MENQIRLNIIQNQANIAKTKPGASIARINSELILPYFKMFKFVLWIRANIAMIETELMLPYYSFEYNTKPG